MKPLRRILKYGFDWRFRVHCLWSINARRPQDNKEDAYASFARLSCNERTYKTKLVHRNELLKWEGEIFALHFSSRTKLKTSEIKISIVDWDVEDVVIGSVTFRGGDLADGIHKLIMRGLEDDGDDHVRFFFEREAREF